MKRLKLVLLFLLIFVTTNFSAQTGHKDFSQRLASTLKYSSWIVQIGGNVIDDDDFTNLHKNWTIPPYPTRLCIEKQLKLGWSIEMNVNYYLLKSHKIVGNREVFSKVKFPSIDVNIKYNFNELYSSYQWFAPFLLTGTGYTYRSALTENYQPANLGGDLMKSSLIVTKYCTLNVGLGLHVWIYNKKLGINIQTAAKFGLILTSPKYNYVQHSLGIVYKFNFNGKKHAQKSETGGEFFKKRNKYVKFRIPNH